MAKKNKKRAAPRKKVRKPVARRAVPSPVEIVASQETTQKRGPGLGTVALVLALAAGLFIFLRKTETPAPTKVAAGLQVSPAPTPEATGRPAQPKKRSTSPKGPYVWNRSKTKDPIRFMVVREKGGIAEVMIFKTGNVSIQLLSSEKGPRKTVELRWDGKDSKGQLVPPGTYYARISGAHGDMVEEIQVK